MILFTSGGCDDVLGVEVLKVALDTLVDLIKVEALRALLAGCILQLLMDEAPKLLPLVLDVDQMLF